MIQRQLEKCRALRYRLRERLLTPLAIRHTLIRELELPQNFVRSASQRGRDRLECIVRDGIRFEIEHGDSLVLSEYTAPYRTK